MAGYSFRWLGAMVGNAVERWILLDSAWMWLTATAMCFLERVGCMMRRANAWQLLPRPELCPVSAGVDLQVAPSDVDIRIGRATKSLHPPTLFYADLHLALDDTIFVDRIKNSRSRVEKAMSVYSIAAAVKT